MESALAIAARVCNPKTRLPFRMMTRTSLTRRRRRRLWSSRTTQRRTTSSRPTSSPSSGPWAATWRMQKGKHRNELKQIRNLFSRVKLETHLRDRSPLQLPKIAKGDSLFNYSVNPHRQDYARLSNSYGYVHKCSWSHWYSNTVIAVASGATGMST